MAAIFRGDGSQITVVTPADGVIEGQIVAIGNLIGIASETRDEGTTLNLYRTGTFTVPKIAADDYAAGDAVYYDAASGKASAQTGELPLLGYVVADAPVDNTEVLIVLAYAQPAGGSPVAAYTEISFTWYQAGTNAPVIASQNTLPSGTTITPFKDEEDGICGFRFPVGTLTSTSKVEVLYNTMVSSTGGYRLLSHQIVGRQLFFSGLDTTFTPANNVSAADYTPVTTVIRIFPA